MTHPPNNAMTQWFYYDKNGEKRETNADELKRMAQNGTITPDTIVETENGKKAKAGNVKGLIFLDVAPPPIWEWPVEPTHIRHVPPPLPPQSAPSLKELLERQRNEVGGTTETANEQDVQGETEESEPLPQKATWHYYDTTGAKQGPIAFNKLQILAMHGVIKKDTLLEHEDGDMIPAGNAYGLSFKEEQPVRRDRQAPSHNRDAQQIVVHQRSTLWDTVLALIIFFIVLPTIGLILFIASCSSLVFRLAE